MPRLKYNTKFSKLTLAIKLEPETYLKTRLSKDWHPMQIYRELDKIADKHHLPMVEKRTLYLWISRLNKKNGRRK